MTKEEFKEKAVPLFRRGPSEEGRAKMKTLLDEAKTIFPLKEVAMMAAEALDEAYPSVAAFRGPDDTATARMARRFAAS